ncbi:MAG: hypothetical protein KGN78_00980 [Actinomycetales bacterium]|nr:hypothetical protein [Actinomycetales bacterium]
MAGTLYSFSTVTPWIRYLDVPPRGYLQRVLGRAVAQETWQAPGVTPAIDLVDETFIAADRAEIAAVVADPSSWRTWWSDLSLTVFMDRGPDGIRWSATGALVGSVEIWLEQFGDGTLLHYFLRAEPSGQRRLTRTRATRIRHQRATAWKRQVWALKDAMEGGRLPGETVGSVQRS